MGHLTLENHIALMNQRVLKVLLKIEGGSGTAGADAKTFGRNRATALVFCSEAVALAGLPCVDSLAGPSIPGRSIVDTMASTKTGLAIAIDVPKQTHSWSEIVSVVIVDYWSAAATINQERLAATSMYS